MSFVYLGTAIDNDKKTEKSNRTLSNTTTLFVCERTYDRMYSTNYRRLAQILRFIKILKQSI
ncbi:hypothetical protein CHRY9390_02595 [Chryseobacterium aquaeductus]|uniref:Uncharacterized protein n=1 Tax=Chryseobacterium aquaeductus TaxID=2675056 RepID=A0A9N8MIP2_9FLAO|nr:hypothetical protein CHRY9390_02595 [Chryseobacterium potabilaquae]CAD7813009.1 hypothetical protein CHRY9390_02595 [Chryseobacterium aquaeductus]